MTVALLTCGCERTVPVGHPTDSLGMPKAIHCPHHRRAYAVVHTIAQGYERDDLTTRLRDARDRAMAPDPTDQLDIFGDAA